LLFVLAGIGDVVRCPRCKHPYSEHYRWLIVPSRCRTCNRWWCLPWMG
jgi:hypothetical protein